MRRKPYTERGISKVPCERCGAPSVHQWQICALDNQWAGVCNECDIELNMLVLQFMGVKDREKIIEKYRRQNNGQEI